MRLEADAYKWFALLIDHAPAKLSQAHQGEVEFLRTMIAVKAQDIARTVGGRYRGATETLRKVTVLLHLDVVPAKVRRMKLKCAVPVGGSGGDGRTLCCVWRVGSELKQRDLGPCYSEVDAWTGFGDDASYFTSLFCAHTKPIESTEQRARRLSAIRS